MYHITCTIINWKAIKKDKFTCNNNLIYDALKFASHTLAYIEMLSKISKSIVATTIEITTTVEIIFSIVVENAFPKWCYFNSGCNRACLCDASIEIEIMTAS